MEVTSTKNVFLVAVSLFPTTNAHAQQPTADVLLFGVFHFHNPGRDVVRVDQTDVTTSDSQAYLETLTARLCDFRPTVILLEFDRAREPEVQLQLATYLRGESELSVNEIHQIDFGSRKSAVSIGSTALTRAKSAGMQSRYSSTLKIPNQSFSKL